MSFSENIITLALYYCPSAALAYPPRRVEVFHAGDRSSRSPDFLLAFSSFSASFAQPGPNL
ncbi:hypothetical protein S83_042197, partial [Arachis hypogaea]